MHSPSRISGCLNFGPGKQLRRGDAKNLLAGKSRSQRGLPVESLKIAPCRFVVQFDEIGKFFLGEAAPLAVRPKVVWQFWPGHMHWQSGDTALAWKQTSTLAKCGGMKLLDSCSSRIALKPLIMTQSRKPRCSSHRGKKAFRRYLFILMSFP